MRHILNTFQPGMFDLFEVKGYAIFWRCSLSTRDRTTSDSLFGRD